MRPLLIVVHRWVALVASVIIIALALTGGALVFEGAMDRGLHPQLWRVQPSDRWVSLDSMIAGATRAVPNAADASISLPKAPDRAAMVQIGQNQIFVNPYTGRVQGRRTSAEARASLPSRLHATHIALMSGQVGRDVVGVVTALSLLLVLTGVIVWWRDKLWRVRWSASWKRIVFDLHHTLGVFASVVITIIASSGVVMHSPRLSQAVLKLDSSPRPRAPQQPVSNLDAPSISADSVSHVAARALPGARTVLLSLPSKPDAPFVASLRFPEDGTPVGRSRVYVDRFTGAVLLAVSSRDAQLGTRIANSLRPMHTGDILGAPGALIWLAAAIVLASQAVTGTTMWWNGRRARKVLGR